MIMNRFLLASVLSGLFLITFNPSPMAKPIPSVEEVYAMILEQQELLDQQRKLIEKQSAELSEIKAQLSQRDTLHPSNKTPVRSVKSMPAQQGTFGASTGNGAADSTPTQASMEEADGGATNPENRIKPKWYAAAKFAYSMPDDVDGSFSKDGTKEDGFAKLSESAQINLALGRRLTQMLRAEVEFGRTQYDIDSVVDDVTRRSRRASGNVTLYSSLLNAYLDIQNRTRFTPYFGAGVGATFVKGNDISLEQSSTSMEEGDVSTTVANKSAWIPTGMLAAGSSYDISRNLELDLAYKAFFSGDLTGSRKGTSGESDVLISHNAMLGLRYNFDDLWW